MYSPSHNLWFPFIEANPQNRSQQQLTTPGWVDLNPGVIDFSRGPPILGTWEDGLFFSAAIPMIKTKQTKTKKKEAEVLPIPFGRLFRSGEARSGAEAGEPLQVVADGAGPFVRGLHDGHCPSTLDDSIPTDPIRFAWLAVGF